MIRITQDDMDIGSFIQEARHRTTGAIVIFLGVVRDDGIESMEIEAFEEVACGDLEVIREDAVSRFQLLSVDIVHRIGHLQVGDDILLIVVSAVHRREAFQGCEYILERIKERVPVWKKELLEDGERWVKGDHAQTGRD